MFKKIYWILDKIRSMVIIGMLGYIVILSFVQIVLRYFTSADLKPFAWGDEIIRLMAVWVAFLAASVGVKQESHLSVQFFLDRFLTPAQLRIVKKCAIFVVMACPGVRHICRYHACDEKYHQHATESSWCNHCLVLCIHTGGMFLPDAGIWHPAVCQGRQRKTH